MRRTNDLLTDLMVDLMRIPTSLVGPMSTLNGKRKEMGASMADSFDNAMKEYDDFLKDMSVSVINSNVIKTETGVIVKAELPGFKKEDISVDVEDNVLTIFADMKAEEETDKEYIRKEIRTGKFMRKFNLDGYDKDSIKADYTDGILSVSIDAIKKEPTDKKKIEIM